MKIVEDKIIIIVIVALIAGCEKDIKGYVFDCETNEPIEESVVSTNQSGWGINNGQLVWDKSYKTFTNTDERGYFELSFDVGDSAKIHVKKEGYFSAEQFESPGDDIKIGMLKGGGALDYTHNCHPLSECISCVEKNGVTTCRDICFD